MQPDDGRPPTGLLRRPGIPTAAATAPPETGPRTARLTVRPAIRHPREVRGTADRPATRPSPRAYVRLRQLRLRTDPRGRSRSSRCRRRMTTRSERVRPDGRRAMKRAWKSETGTPQCCSTTDMIRTRTVARRFGAGSSVGSKAIRCASSAGSGRDLRRGNVGGVHRRAAGPAVAVPDRPGLPPCLPGRVRRRILRLRRALRCPDRAGLGGDRRRPWHIVLSHHVSRPVSTVSAGTRQGLLAGRSRRSQPGPTVWRRDGYADAEFASMQLRVGRRSRSDLDGLKSVDDLTLRADAGSIVVGAGDRVQPRVWDLKGDCGGRRIVDFVPAGNDRPARSSGPTLRPSTSPTRSPSRHPRRTRGGRSRRRRRRRHPLRRRTRQISPASTGSARRSPRGSTTRVSTTFEALLRPVLRD